MPTALDLPLPSVFPFSIAALRILHDHQIVFSLKVARIWPFIWLPLLSPSAPPSKLY